jgi:hypothetical protein
MRCELEKWPERVPTGTECWIMLKCTAFGWTDHIPSYVKVAELGNELN